MCSAGRSCNSARAKCWPRFCVTACRLRGRTSPTPGRSWWLPLGTEALTTKVYASTISQFVALFAMSIGQASQIIIGRATGAREIDKAYQQGIKSWRLG
ncbi:MAG: MATE family efflux transporter, partial [Kluyvera sp.]